MPVTFDTLKPDARIFLELNNNPHWWIRFKEDSSLYIEVRKDNQVNVYFIFWPLTLSITGSECPLGIL